MELQKEVRVLIVEDDSLVGEMIHGVLGKSGFTVIGEALNGEEAIVLTQSLRPDVVLMDIGMPDMDGITAAKQIQATCPTPVVVLTAYEVQDMVEQASAAGVGAYLVKPPKARELERAITIAIARFRDMLELRRLNSELQARNEELQTALAKVKTLSGLLPICANCKKIRDDQGYWQQVEIYIREHADVEFSHGLCPDCTEQLYPEFFDSL